MNTGLHFVCGFNSKRNFQQQQTPAKAIKDLLSSHCIQYMYSYASK